MQSLIPSVAGWLEIRSIAFPFVGSVHSFLRMGVNRSIRAARVVFCFSPGLSFETITVHVWEIFSFVSHSDLLEGYCVHSSTRTNSICDNNGV